MKNLSREKLILLILVIMILILGSGILIWQSFDNSRVISSVTDTLYQGNKETYNSQNNVKEKNENQKVETEFNTRGEDRDSNFEKNELDNSVGIEIKSSSILVHVAGEVVHPGVYQLSVESRVVHAVEAAGGATALANLDIINLASQIYDGQKIYIPSVVENFNQYKQENNAGFSASDSPGKININTASSTKLQELSGVGPGKADNIIDYRNDNGPFQNIDELLDVSGIGEKTLEKIKNEIIVR